MDHILENMDKPIPSADAETSSTPMSNRRFEDDDMDEDDKAALAAHIAKIGGRPGDAQEVAAKSVKCSEVGRLGRLTSRRTQF
jgi:hypothetical protein